MPWNIVLEFRFGYLNNPCKLNKLEVWRPGKIAHHSFLLPACTQPSPTLFYISQKAVLVLERAKPGRKSSCLVPWLPPSVAMFIRYQRPLIPTEANVSPLKDHLHCS